MFGSILDGEMRLNAAGKVVRDVWDGLPTRFSNVEVDAFVIMPNHVHGVLMIVEDGASPMEDFVGEAGVIHHAPTNWGNANSRRTTLGGIVRGFKGAVTYQVRRIVAPSFAWQRNYYEHIIRDERDLKRIREYVTGNPARWPEDSLYVPEQVGV